MKRHTFSSAGLVLLMVVLLSITIAGAEPTQQMPGMPPGVQLPPGTPPDPVPVDNSGTQPSPDQPPSGNQTQPPANQPPQSNQNQPPTVQAPPLMPANPMPLGPLPGTIPSMPSVPTGSVNVIVDPSGLLSVNCMNAPVTEILQSIAGQMQKNLVMNGELRATVSLQLKNMKLEQVLNYISKTVNCNWKEDDGVILVSTQEQMTTSKIFPVKYANLDDVRQALSVLSLGDKVNTSANPRGMIVSASQDKLYEVEKIIKKIDQPVPIVDIEAKMVEMTHDEALTVGINFSANAMWGKDFLTGQYSANASTGMTNKVLNGLYTLTLDQDSVKHGVGKLLARPNISTLNNTEAHISTGDDVPIANKQPGSETYYIDYRHVGIDLYTTPHVVDLDKDMLSIKVKATVSMISQYVQVGTTQAPQVSTREAQTTVMVKSGQMIVIGGLNKEEMTSNRNSFPILGDLPLVGNLFTHVQKTKKDTEVFIFITPRLVKPGM